MRFGSARLSTADRTAERRAIVDTRRAAVVALGRIGDRARVPSRCSALSTTPIPIFERRLRQRLPASATRAPSSRCSAHAETRIRRATGGDRRPELNRASRDGGPDLQAAGRRRPTRRRVGGEDRRLFRLPGVRRRGCVARCTIRTKRSARPRSSISRTSTRRAGADICVQALEQRHAARCRAAAAAALGHVERRPVRRLCAKALHDADAWVRYFAASSLGRDGERSMRSRPWPRSPRTTQPAGPDCGHRRDRRDRRRRARWRCCSSHSP